MYLLTFNGGVNFHSHLPMLWDSLDPLHQWLIGSSQDGSHLYLPQHLAGFIAVEGSCYRKYGKNDSKSQEFTQNISIWMRIRAWKVWAWANFSHDSWPLDLETLEVWCGANADICELDLEPKDQDGVGGTTRGDQDVDLQNGWELVVVQETWHIRMWF